VEDLFSFRADAAHLLEETAIPQVLAIPGIAYYSIENLSPISLLGYMAVLEGTPPLHSFINHLQSELQLPEQAFRTLLVHSSADVAHAEELFAVADSLDVAPNDKKSAIRAAAHTSSMYAIAMGYLLGSSCRKVSHASSKST
jgi:hypothetical protein